MTNNNNKKSIKDSNFEIVILKEELKVAVETAFSFAGKNKHPVKILGNVFLRTKQDGIEVHYTNLADSCNIQIPADILQEGCLTISVNDLMKVLRVIDNLPIRIAQFQDDTVEIKVDDGNEDSMSFELDSLCCDDFPKFNPIESPLFSLKIAHSFVKRNVNRVLISASKDVHDADLHGVCFEKKNDILKWVSTDLKRMTIYQQPYMKNVENAEYIKFIEGLPDFRIILPFKLLKLTSSLFSGQEENNNNWTVTISEDRIELSIKTHSNLKYLFSCKKPMGTFPNIESASNNDLSQRYPIMVAKKELLKTLTAIKKVKPIGKEVGDQKVLNYLVSFTVNKNKLEIIYNCGMKIKAKVPLLIYSEMGDMSFSTGLNYQYLIDAVEPIDTKGVALHIPLDSPLKITQSFFIYDDNTIDYFSVIMGVDTEGI